MSDSRSELCIYIDDSLKKYYTLQNIIKDTEQSKINVYKHNITSKKIVHRTSTIRNDDVYRSLRNMGCGYLPQIYEVCSDEKCLVILEEFVEGKSLLEILEEKKKVPEYEAYKYILNICSALEILHSKGIIHRDIKPSNVIIDNNNNAILIDLSIARAISSNPESDTQNLGSVGFAAPEQFGISQSGKTTDIYALGVLFNILVTGVHPAIETPGGKIGKIIAKMVSVEMNARYQNIQEVKTAINKLL